jgi:putative inorganic carbon (hco3(-)) transporter
MSLEWVVFLLIVVPGLLYAMRGSSYLVDYTILVFVFNREIRRLVDYSNHHFNPFSLISLTPLVMLGLLFLGFLWNFKALHRLAKRIFVLMLVAIAYGFAVGILHNGLATLYQGAEYLSTVGLMGYVAVNPADDKTADRWLRTAGIAAAVAAFYGWYQFLTIPDWDAFWVDEVGFVGYLGQLQSTQMWVFSTFPDRGPCAAYMALVAIPMMISRRWRLTVGWPEALLLLSCIFLTMARVGIILVIVGVLLYPILNGGKGSGRVLLFATLACGILFAGLNSVPGADRIVQRFGTLGHMQDDGSFQGRVQIFHDIAPEVWKNPVGYGIGSSGVGSRLKSAKSDSVVADNGWLELMTSLGWFGFLLFAVALALLWKYFATLVQLGVRDDYLALARTYLVVVLIFTWVGNFFIEFTVMWIAMGRALSPLMLYKVDPEVFELSEIDTLVDAS